MIWCTILVALAGLSIWWLNSYDEAKDAGVVQGHKNYDNDSAASSD